MSPESLLFHHFLVCQIVCITSLALSLFVVWKGGGRLTSIIFALYMVSIALWAGVGGFVMISKDAVLATKLYQLNHIGVIWIPAFFLHFVESLRIKSDNRVTYKSIAPGYLFAVIYTILNVFGTLITDVQPRSYFNSLLALNAVYASMMVFWMLIITLALFRLFKIYLTSDPVRKNQLSYFCIATVIAYVGGAINFAPIFGIPLLYLIPFGMYAIPLYAAVTVYAIFAKNLMDIRVVLKRALLYGFFVFAISLTYMGLVFVLHQLIFSNKSGSSAFNFSLLESLNLHSATANNPLLLKNAFVSHVITSITTVLLAIFVFLKGRGKTTNRTYALYTLSVGFWSIFIGLGMIDTNPDSALLKWKIAHIGVSCIPAFFLHFVCSLNPRRSRMSRLILPAAYIYAVTTSVFAMTGDLVRVQPKYFYAHQAHYNVAYTIYFWVWTAFVVYGLFELFRTCLQSGRERRSQLSYFCISMMIAYIGGGASFLPIFDMAVSYLNPFGTYAIPIYLFVTAHAILAYRLMDIEVVIKRTFFYFFLAFLVSMIYIFLIFGVHRLYLNHSQPGTLINVIAILIIASLIKPIEMLMHRLLDKRFFKGSIAELSEEKERMRVELERRERLKSVGILASGMAHEIKNPLTAISSFVEYLPKKYDDPKFREDFHRIVTGEVARMKAIVQELLDFSKPSTPVKESVDIRQLLSDILELLSKRCQDSRVEASLVDGGSIFARVDAGQIKQALLNVILNAIEAMPSGGVLTVEITESPNEVQISIRDTGCGIDPKRIQEIFDPFYSQKSTGTGLGLSVTHSIIEQHGGFVSVDSHLGSGSAFYITLPS